MAILTFQHFGVGGIFIKVAPIAGSVTLILLMLIIPQIQYKIYKNTYWKHGE